MTDLIFRTCERTGSLSQLLTPLLLLLDWLVLSDLKNMAVAIPSRLHNAFIFYVTQIDSLSNSYYRGNQSLSHL
jgi:hypothetical protein